MARGTLGTGMMAPLQMANNFHGDYYAGPSGAAMGALMASQAIGDGFRDWGASKGRRQDEAKVQAEKDRIRAEDMATRKAVAQTLDPMGYAEGYGDMGNRPGSAPVLPDAATQVSLYGFKQKEEERKMALQEQDRQRKVIPFAMQGGLMNPEARAQFMQAEGYDPLPYAPKEAMDQFFPNAPQLSGDAENLAVILGRTPTAQELMSYRQSGRSVTNVNTGDRAFDKAMGEQWAKGYDGLFTAARTAEEGMPTIEAGRAILNSADFQTGKLEPAKMWAAQVASGLGIDPNKLGLESAASGEAFQSVVMKNLLNELAKQKGPQTEGDAARALKANIQLGNTPEGNAFILDYAEALNRRTIEKAQWVYEAGTKKYNGDVYKAEQDWNKRINNRPLLATSPKSGLPVTYYQYTNKAMESGLSQDEADVQWLKFVNAGNKGSK